MNTKGFHRPLLSRVSVCLRLQPIWQYKRLLWSLIVRNLKVKYQRSILGFLWTMLNPLLTSIILISVFTYIVLIPIDNYWAFLLSGFFVWNAIHQCLNDATFVLSSHANLRRSVAFSTEILIWSACFLTLFELIIELILLSIALVIFLHHGFPTSLVLLPLVVLMQIVLIVGLMYPISVAAILFHDVQHVLPIVITGLFYLTPVFYSLELIPEVIRPYCFINPFVGLIKLYRIILYEGQWPPIGLFGFVAACAVGVHLVGSFFFNRYKNVCVEIA